MDYKNFNDYEVVYMIRENDEDSRNLMFRKYFPVVRRYAFKFLDFAKNHGMELDDLIQEGMIALNHAIDYYSENSGVLFYTYATLCIQRHLITFCRNIGSNRHLILNQSVSDEFISYRMENAYTEHFFSFEEDEFVFIKNLFDLKYSSVFELRYNGFSYREISELLDVPISTIDGRICKIKKVLFEQFLFE